MKKRIFAMALVSMLLILIVPMRSQASEKEPSVTEAAETLEQIKDELSAAFDKMDQETASQVFSFVQEKIKEGALSSEENLKEAIKEGEEKFGMKVDAEAAKQVVSTMEKLEEMGFSSEKIVGKAGELYQQYGADFVEHTDEAVKSAVKDAVKNAAGSFWNNLKGAVANFFQNLF